MSQNIYWKVRKIYSPSIRTQKWFRIAAGTVLTRTYYNPTHLSSFVIILIRIWTRTVQYCTTKNSKSRYISLLQHCPWLSWIRFNDEHIHRFNLIHIKIDQLFYFWSFRDYITTHLKSIPFICTQQCTWKEDLYLK